METTFIYALCEPHSRTVRYIGKANDPKHRFLEHLWYSVKFQSHLGCWLRSLLSQGEKPNLVILREIPDSHWQISEERYIRLAKGLGMSLVNGTEGGEGLHNPSTETRAKISAAVSARNRGRTVSLETRKKLSSASRGKPMSLESRKKLSAAGRLRTQSEESRRKIGATQKLVWARRKAAKV